MRSRRRRRRFTQKSFQRPTGAGRWAVAGRYPSTSRCRNARRKSPQRLSAARLDSSTAVFGHGHRAPLALLPHAQYKFRMFDVAAQYQAVQRRDPALDGVVFIAVKTTGIYCRPVCRARTPLAHNIEFYPSAAAAERAGYRPCLRCRPETAPFCPAWKGTRTTVERALALIEAGALDRNSVEALAEKLGIGPRHLSRLFVEHLDAPPLQVALSLRIQRAKRLLDDTDLPIALIASRAGFSSSRRMRDAFAQLYGRSPSALRKRQTDRSSFVAAGATSGSSIGRRSL
jgi:AraC family transcriptional regulator of adaptative response/methylated-DNA-[protein]-cysteine methyltransferase